MAFVTPVGICWIFWIFVAHFTAGGVNEDQLKGRRIVCIFNNKQSKRLGFKPSMIKPHLCTHINYEFAILDPKTYELMPGEPDIDTQMDPYREAVDLKKRDEDLKVILSLGGWEDSTKKYSELVASDVNRKNFIEKAIKFLKSYGFDGLNIDWEYPNCWQGALGVNPADKKNFGIFLKELREKFDVEKLILSISASAIKPEILVAYDVEAVAKYVDFVNLMTYDLHGPWELRTGHHAQYDKSPDDPDPTLNMKGAVDMWTGLGVDKKKLNIGIPTYARTYKLSNPRNVFMGARADGRGSPGPVSQQAGILCYNEICQYLNAGNWTEDEDKYAGFFAYGAGDWASYDPPMTVVRKTKFVLENGYGGVLIKDFTCDTWRGECFNEPFLLIKMTRMEIQHRLKKLEKYLNSTQYSKRD